MGFKPRAKTANIMAVLRAEAVAKRIGGVGVAKTYTHAEMREWVVESRTLDSPKSRMIIEQLLGELLTLQEQVDEQTKCTVDWLQALVDWYKVPTTGFSPQVTECKEPPTPLQEFSDYVVTVVNTDNKSPIGTSTAIVGVDEADSEADAIKVALESIKEDYPDTEWKWHSTEHLYTDKD